MKPTRYARIADALVIASIIAALYAIAGAQTTVAPNYTTGPLWDDQISVAGAINPIGPDGQMTVITDGADYIGCLLADAAGETAVIQFQLPHGYADNTDVKPHIHWLVTGADVTGTTDFQAKFRHCPLSGTCSAWTAFASGTVIFEPADVDGATGLTAWTLADATYNFGISDVILMQFKLNTTSVTSSVVCSADIHIQKSANGSRQEGVR
jgi:hypothetical protein